MTIILVDLGAEKCFFLLELIKLIKLNLFNTRLQDDGDDDVKYSILYFNVSLKAI